MINEKERVFITFDDVIMTPYLNVMKFIKANSETFDDCLDPSLIPEKDNEIMAWLSVRESVNPIEEIAIEEFNDSDELLTLIKNLCGENLYDGKLLPIGLNVTNLASQKVVEKIYIYTEEFDSRVDNIIATYFGDKVVYVHGDFFEVVTAYKPTTYILNDIEKLHALFVDNKQLLEFTNVMISKHGFNVRFVNDTDIDFNYDESIGESAKAFHDIPTKMVLFNQFDLSEEDFGYLVDEEENSDNL